MFYNNKLTKIWQSLITLILLVIVIYWSTEALQKLLSKPIGTKIQYHFGDDNKGNHQIFALTVCPEYFNNFKNLTKFKSLLDYLKQTKDQNWEEVYQEGAFINHVDSKKG